jgi:cytochrome P450
MDDPVLLAKHAANRDRRAYQDPDRLDLTRNAQGQLGFGHGAHHCIGAPLARMDLQVALAALLVRLPGLQLAVADDEVQWKTGMAVRGPVTLPIGW